jgi:hypothetical protein
MTQQQYAQLLMLGGDNAKLEEQMKLQLAQAAAMQPGELRTRGNGRVLKAPNPIELLGNLAQEKTAFDLQGRALKAANQRTTNQTTQNQAILQAIMAQQQAQPQQPAGNGFMPPQQRSPYSLTGP